MEEAGGRVPKLAPGGAENYAHVIITIMVQLACSKAGFSLRNLVTQAVVVISLNIDCGTDMDFTHLLKC